MNYHNKPCSGDFAKLEKDFEKVNTQRLEYVVQSVEDGRYRWRVVSKKELLKLNPHDIVDAYEIGKPVKVSVCVQ